MGDDGNDGENVVPMMWRGDQEILLSAREYAVLQYLAVRRGQIVTRDELFENVYDMAAEPGSCMPSDSAMEFMVVAVPMVLQ